MSICVNFFQKKLSEYETVWILIRLDVLSVLIWVQTICKGHLKNWFFACWVIVNAFDVFCWLFFKINFFQKNSLRKQSECQPVCILIRTDIFSVLIWVQTICKGHQKLEPSINGLVTDRNTKLCCWGFALALFQSTTAYNIYSKHTWVYTMIFSVCIVEYILSYMY